MPDINEMISDLRGAPDQALQQQLQQPSGLVPSYLVLAEAQRRATLRQAQQQQQSQGQSSSTVLDDVVRNMMSSQPPPGPPAPAGMTPPRQGQSPMPGAGAPGQMPTPTPPQGMWSGGRFADGGEASDDNDAGDFGVGGWIDKYANQYGVEPAMAHAIAEQESGGNTRAVSNKGALGPFQLMPETAKEMGVDPRDPEQNVKGGIRYFKQQLDKYGEPTLALAAYNAGPGAVDKYGGVPPFTETLKYVPAVMARYNKFKQSEQPSADRAAPADATQTQQPAPQQPATPQQPAPAPQQTPFEQASQALGNGLPDVQSPAAQAATPGQDTTFSTTVHPGRIKQNISDLQGTIDGINKRIAELPDPYGPENVEKVRQIIPTIYGVGSDYLQNLSAQADMRAATINQLQDEILQRYHNPNPWEFLSNIAGGMSGSLNLAQGFGKGVAQAWQQRDAQQQQSVTDYDTLERIRQGLYSNVEGERGRMGQTLASYLEHQAASTQDSRKILQSQLDKATAEQDKWKKMLVPTNKLEALYNPDDYGPEDQKNAQTAFILTHGGAKVGQKRMDEELNAIQFLKSQGDPFVQGGQYGTAYDQVVAKYPDQAATVIQNKPAAPISPLNKNLIKTTYLTNRPFVDGRNYTGKRAQEVQEQVDNTPGMTYLGKDQAESLDNIEDSQRGFDSMEKSMLSALPRDSTGHVIQANITVPMNKLIQFNPVLASWGAWRANAIAQLRAAAGSKGLRINEAEIHSAVQNDIPQDSDTVGAAMRKLSIMRRTIQNQEDTLFHTRGREGPAADLPVIAPTGQLGYVPAAAWNKYEQQGYKLVQ